MIKDFCILVQVFLKNFNSLRYKKAKILFNTYRGGSKREKEQPGHTSGLVDNCPTVPSTMLCCDCREEVWFYSSKSTFQGNKMLRLHAMGYGPAIFSSKSLGPTSWLQERQQFGCRGIPLILGETALLYPFSGLHLGAMISEGSCTPVSSLTAAPAFL